VAGGGARASGLAGLLCVAGLRRVSWASTAGGRRWAAAGLGRKGRKVKEVVFFLFLISISV
jgi:hypothetical protein